jgi:peptidoglycan/xylan/chitin deacetylase (PgdA/CDA1 family)
LSRIRFIEVILFSIQITACSGRVRANIEPLDFEFSTKIPATTIGTSTPFPLMSDTPPENPPTYIYTPTNSPSQTIPSIPTASPIPTTTPSPSDTPVPTMEMTFQYIPAGFVTAPVLLYHQISDKGEGNRYYVTVEDFREQMQILRDLGYQTITPSDLVNVLIHGGELPVRPVVITFDDGNLSVYQNAFPIMHEMGFVGALYIYVNRLNSVEHVNVEQLMEMVDNGWEIGSHSMSHANLIDYSSIAPYELYQSRLTLEDAIEGPVVTFAYPYGRADNYIRGMIGEYGYIAGMGLGPSWEHTLDTITYLSRIEVQSDYDLDKFISLLPWKEN